MVLAHNKALNNSEVDGKIVASSHLFIRSLDINVNCEMVSNVNSFSPAAFCMPRVPSDSFHSYCMFTKMT